MTSRCETCAAVAKGGRIRLTEETAQLIEALLRSARRASVRARRRAIDRDDTVQKAESDHQLKMIDFVIEELEDTQFTNRWHSADGRLYE